MLPNYSKKIVLYNNMLSSVSIFIKEQRTCCEPFNPKI